MKKKNKAFYFGLVTLGICLVIILLNRYAVALPQPVIYAIFAVMGLCAGLYVYKMIRELADKRKANRVIKKINEDGDVEVENEEDEEDGEGNYMSLGLCIGMCLGMSFGQLLFDDTSTGMCMGMCIGLAIGSCIKKKK